MASCDFKVSLGARSKRGRRKGFIIAPESRLIKTLCSRCLPHSRAWRVFDANRGHYWWRDKPERDGSLRAAQLFGAPWEAPMMGVHPEAGKSSADVPKRSGTCSRGIFCNIKVRSLDPWQGCTASPAGREEDACAESDPNPSHGSPHPSYNPLVKRRVFAKVQNLKVSSPGQSWMAPLGSIPLGRREGLGGLGWVSERNPAGCAGVGPHGSGVGSSRQAVELTHGVQYVVCCRLGND